MIAPRLLSPRVLYGAAIGFVLVGIALRSSPSSPPVVASSRIAPILVAQRRHVSDTQEDTSAYAPIAAADVFSPTRAPPTVRFTPDRATNTPAPAPALHRARVAGPGIRLFGITTAPSGAIALLGADPRSPSAKIYRVGDRVPGGSVAAITDSTVVIARARGQLVLRLPSAKKQRP